MYTFDDEVKPRSGAFYVRQIVSSANYAMGSDSVDFVHGWLNYQIEHHVWPDLRFVVTVFLCMYISVFPPNLSPNLSLI